MNAQLPSLGTTLRRLRQAAGLSQEELAERAGISLRTVGNIENEAAHAPRRDTLERLAEALGLAPEAAALLAYVSAPVATTNPIDSTPSGAQLPYPPYPLLGRECELDTLPQRLPRGGLLTLTGPAGVGKTRLAIAIAQRVQQDYRDGAVFISLAALDDPTLVASAILQALRIRFDDTQPDAETLTTALREKQTLLLLDNFEHLVPAAEMLARLLSDCPQLSVLATSRVALRVRGEQEFAVSPLALPQPEDIAQPQQLLKVPSVALLVQRAQALLLDFQLTPANAQPIAELCRRLDGLPLALELIAGRLRLFSPKALLERLGDQIRLVAGGPADLPLRQQTLRAALAWSYDLLSPDAQRLFRWLAVFRDGAALSAIETMCCDIADATTDATIAELVETLLEQHLVSSQPDDDPRIGMLHTIQAFARERLGASGEQETAQRAHTAYYLNFVERAWHNLVEGDQALGLECLDREQANWRAALAWTIEASRLEWALRLAGALGRYWYERGSVREGRAWLEQTLRLSDPGASAETTAQHETQLAPHRVRALFYAGWLAYRQGDYDQAQTWLATSAEIAGSLADQPARNMALNGLGSVALKRGDYTRAATLFAEIAQYARQTGNERLVAVAANNLGIVELGLGKYATAYAAFEECARLCQTLGAWGTKARALSNIALVKSDQGDYLRALALCEESYALQEMLEASREQADVLNTMAFIACSAGTYAEAAKYCAESFAHYQSDGDQSGIAHALLRQGHVSLALGSLTNAIACCERGLSLALDLEKWLDVTEAHMRLGDARRDLGQWERATYHYRSALALYRRLGLRRALAPLLEGIALLAGLRDQPQRARWIMGQAERLRTELGAVPTAYERRGRERIFELAGLNVP